MGWVLDLSYSYLNLQQVFNFLSTLVDFYHPKIGAFDSFVQLYIYIYIYILVKWIADLFCHNWKLTIIVLI